MITAFSSLNCSSSAGQAGRAGGAGGGQWHMGGCGSARRCLHSCLLLPPAQLPIHLH
jgi:hypothetical protein